LALGVATVLVSPCFKLATCIRKFTEYIKCYSNFTLSSYCCGCHYKLYFVSQMCIKEFYIE